MSQTPINLHAIQPVRWVVQHRCLNEDRQSEEVLVSYNGTLPESLSFAISTASRYAGKLYADIEDKGPGFYRFIRSYAGGEKGE